MYRKGKMFYRPAFLLFALFFLISCKDGEQFDSLDVICLGDSITYGLTLTDPVHESYPARLQEQSEGKWQVQNLGVSGATALSKGDLPLIAQKAYQIAMQSRPDVVVLMLGTNDTKNYNWKYIGDFVQDYKRIIVSLQQLDTHPRVIACTIPPAFLSLDVGLNAEHIKVINTMIRVVVQETGVELLDVHHQLVDKMFLFNDGIHPNATGAVEIASFVSQKISNN